MVALKVSAFGGAIPAQDDRLLPENNAAESRNCFLDSGAIQGMRVPKLLHTLTSPSAQYAFRIPLAGSDRLHLNSSLWMEFDDPDTNVLKSPVANDQFERFYFVSPTQQPSYNTKARIANGDPAFVLGIPAPPNAPGVVASGGSGSQETRAYVTTWVSAYAEEGPPSPAILVTGYVNGSWDVTLTPAAPPDTTGRNLSKVRLYRTITALSGDTTYYLVAELPMSTTNYSDVTSSLALSSNSILQSADWGAPPSDLEGWVSMPNGMIAAWKDNEIWFCEPFRPHAWPAAYTTSIDAKVVGLGVVGQTLVVCTDGFPYAASGINPSNMAFSKIATFEPCMSRGSIVSTANGVFYASPNGIVLAAYGIVQNASIQLATKDRWLEKVRPETLRAARFGASYYAWGTPVFGSFQQDTFQNDAFDMYDYEYAFSGILVSLTDPRIAWTDLTHNVGTTTNVSQDLWSGELFLIRDGAVYWLDPTYSAEQGSFLWRSKIYQLSYIRNLGALRVRFDKSSMSPQFVQNPTRDTSFPQDFGPGKYGVFRVYADGKLVMAREMRDDGEVMRLPTGFKASDWQFEIEARVRVYNLEVGSSVRELRGV